jgi:hypothetical protein
MGHVGVRAATGERGPWVFCADGWTNRQGSKEGSVAPMSMTLLAFLLSAEVPKEPALTLAP